MFVCGGIKRRFARNIYACKDLILPCKLLVINRMLHNNSCYAHKIRKFTELYVVTSVKLGVFYRCTGIKY